MGVESKEASAETSDRVASSLFEDTREGLSGSSRLLGLEKIILDWSKYTKGLISATRAWFF